MNVFRIASAVVTAITAGSFLVWPTTTVDGRGLLLLVLSVFLVLTLDHGGTDKVEGTAWQSENTMETTRRR